MQRDFTKELKKIIKETNPIILKTDKEARQQRLDEDCRKNQEVFGELYAIHKRRLVGGEDPRHQLNQRIIWNLPKDEAEWWLKYLKPRLIDEDKRIVEYYEKVRQDGKYSGVLDNEFFGNKVTKLEGSDAKKEYI